MHGSDSPWCGGKLLQCKGAIAYWGGVELCSALSLAAAV